MRGHIERAAFRRKRNLWLAYASELAAPMLRAVTSLRARRATSPPKEWRRGLILGHTHIGDILYRTCSLPALRERLPHCEWTYVTSPSSAEVLANNPHVHDVLPLIVGENSWNLSNGGFDELASRDFDVVLCSNTLRHYPDLALSAAVGIPNRVAFSGKGLSGLMTHAVRIPFPAAYAAYFRAMVASVTGMAPEWTLRPRLYPSLADHEKAAGVWRSFGFDGVLPVVACSLRTRQAAGNWPADVLLSVLESARSRKDFEVVFCGAPEDAATLRSLATRFPFASHIFAGEAGLLAFAAFLGRCDLLLTMDSGPRHIGNAMQIPVLFARNLSHSMIEAGAYCKTETDIAPPVEYLSDHEAADVARAQPVGLLAEKLLGKLSAADTRASSPLSS